MYFMKFIALKHVLSIEKSDSDTKNVLHEV